MNESYVTALWEANLHLTRALEALEDVPSGAVFADPQDRLQLQWLIICARGAVTSELTAHSW